MEFQMYLLAPVVVWFYAKRRRWGYYAAVAFILTCLIIRAAINIYYGFSDYGSGTWKTGTSEHVDNARLIYRATWSRMAEYFVGVLCCFSFTDHVDGYHRTRLVDFCFPRPPPRVDITGLSRSMRKAIQRFVKPMVWAVILSVGGFFIYCGDLNQVRLACVRPLHAGEFM